MNFRKIILFAILINLLFINIVIARNLHARGEVTENVESDEKYIMGKGEIIVGVETNKPPMSYLDDNGELTGFDTEFTIAVFKKNGIDVVFKEIEWSMKEVELNNKSIDCIWNSLTVTEERRKTIEFSRVYINNRQAVVIRRVDASKFPDAKSLSSAKMAAGLATTGEEALLGDPDLSQSDYTPLVSQNEAVVSLMNGLYDAIVIDYTLAKGYIPNDNSELMVIESIRLQEEQYAVGFRHGSDMTKRVNDVFLDMMLDGSLTELSEKYNLFDLYGPLEITDAVNIMNNKKIVIGVQDDMPPMTFYDKNNQLTGFDIEFAKMVGQQLGLEIEFKIIMWDKKEVELRSRNIDCIWNALTVTEERRNIMKFSRVYMSNKQVLIIRKSDESKYTDLKSLSNANISALSKSTGESVIENDSYLSQSNYIKSNSVDKAILYLKNEEVDAIVLDYTVASDSIANGNSDIMIVEGIHFDEEVYAVGFRVESDMTVKINELINNSINDGTLESLAKKYNLLDLYNSAISPNENSDYNYIMSKGEMIIGIEDNIPPLSYYNDDGDLTGFNIEFAKSVCSNLGIDAKFQIIDWENKETELNNKNIDCLWNPLAITEERRKNIEFTHVYLNNQQVIVIRKSDASKFKDTKSLSTAKISAVYGSTGEEIIKSDSYLSQAKYTSSSSQYEAILFLKNGNVDGIIIDYVIAKGNIDNGNTDLMIIEGINLQNEQYAVGLRVGSDMIKKINNIILDLIMDGSLSTISKKYNLFDLFSSLRVTDAGYIIGKGKMIIGYNGSVPPLSYDDNNGQLTGFDIEFAKAVCQQLDIEAEFKIISWDKKETELKERNIDCIWNGLTVTDESRNNMKFTRIYMSNTQVIVIKKSNASKFSSIKSFIGENISAVIGSKAEEIIKKNTYLSKAIYIESDTPNNAILSLKKGTVNAIIIDYSMALDITTDIDSELMILDEFNDEFENYAVGFRLDSDMTVKVNDIINKMFSDGSLASLANKYNMMDLYNIVTKTDKKSDMDYIMSKGEMLIGIEVGNPPMNYYDEYGDLIGFDCELAKKVCSKLGIDAVFVNIEWNMKETLLNNKTIDCVWSSFTVTEERRSYFSFSQPYLSNRPAVVIRKSDASKFPDAESLSKSTLSAEIDTTGEEAIFNDPYLSQSNYIVSPTYIEAINGLKNGNFDAIVLDFTLAQGIITNGDSDLMIVKSIHFQEEQYAVGFRIGSDMTSKIDTMIYDMVLDDSLIKHSEKYELIDLFTPCKVTDFKYIMNNGKIIIGFDKTMSPMTYYDSDGQLTGFDIDFAKLYVNNLT